MGRTEPSIGRPPAAFRKDVRSKKAKATINKVIPSLLPGNSRAQQGIDAAELIPFQTSQASKVDKTIDQAKKGKSGRRSSTSKSDGQASPPPSAEAKPPRIVVREVDTLKAARGLLEIETPSGTKADLKNDRARVAILNMGSPLSPGGGFLNGANSQEESLCMRTTLYPSLKDEWYRIPDLASIYTPNVLVFRDEEAEDLDKKDRFYVDCITAAMIRTPEYEMDNEGIATYANKKDRELAQNKMRAVMRVAVMKKTKRLVLGAWGCGAHGNPVGEIARLWKAVLMPKQDKSKGVKERWEQLDEVVFAIKDHNMAQAFAEAFGDGLERLDDDDEEEEGSEEDEGMDVKTKELLTKIEELEQRITTVVNPKVKEGLQSILEGLKKQLPDDGGSVLSEDVRSDGNASS
ncbi:hypothetical protein NW752_001715 [Fusarium irregulare]|uniref:Microbial-type PARG catalytic domain-containing protein n=1 Tax=Fusarium irregulare TaxID=2494466 RepID=A0A9W8UAS8_9HYPO|nr:hypothetical protein NW766_003878 [Fusarium irregulare]KAJ4026761.1 hypothetical protein NW752_001715 [Fusarium irregulare]